MMKRTISHPSSNHSVGNVTKRVTKSTTKQSANKQTKQLQNMEKESERKAMMNNKNILTLIQ
jgi:hypothetical protein